MQGRFPAAVAAAALLLLLVLWIPNHTCMNQTAGRTPCLGCLWGLLTAFVIPLALTATLLREARLRAAFEPARTAFRTRPQAFGRGPPSTRS